MTKRLLASPERFPPREVKVASLEFKGLAIEIIDNFDSTYNPSLHQKLDTKSL